jgi:hypothetical protein
MFNLNRVLILGRGFFPVFVRVFALGSSLIQGHYQKKGLCEPAALHITQQGEFINCLLIGMYV